jgi:hypothetical protein
MSYLARHALSGVGVLTLGKLLVREIKHRKDDDSGSKNLLHCDLRIGQPERNLGGS